MIEFLIGVDGGGSGTRACLARPARAARPALQSSQSGQSSHPGQSGQDHLAAGEPILLGSGSAGPSGLAHGIGNAWTAVEAAIGAAFADAGLAVPPRAAIALGLGMAGVHNRQWAAQFSAADPGYAQLVLASDGHTTVLGAHDGAPGAIIALGTGSVGEVKLADGRHVEVGGWGFPSGDEAGGAWIGLHAINHLQQSFDGRLPPDAFADQVALVCGVEQGSAQQCDQGDGQGCANDGGQLRNQGDARQQDQGCAQQQDQGRVQQNDQGCAQKREAAARAVLQQWLAGATQTSYAQLAPVVLRHAPTNPAARAILHAAGLQVQRIAHALDAGGTLPIALCGGLAAPLRPYLPAALLARVVPARGDSAAGALRLIGQHLQQNLPQ